MRRILPVLACLLAGLPARAETPEEWIQLGTRVHGGFGSFIPLGIRIGEDALRRLGAAPRGVTVLFHDGERAPCACLADGVALATIATIGQRTLSLAPERAPPGALAVIVVRSKATGAALRYTVPDAALPRLGAWNRDLDPRGRFDAVMRAEDLFTVEPTAP